MRLYESQKCVRTSFMNYLENLLNEMFVASLVHADLPKNAFIQKLRIVHGSSLTNERQHDQFPKYLKLPLLAVTSYQTGMLLGAIASDEEDETQKRLNRIPLLDIQIMMRIYAWLNLSEQE